MKKINWPDHLINFLVVIVGITVAFQLGNWKELRKQHQVEKQYAESFLRDLKKDVAQLNSLHHYDSIQFNALVKIFRLKKNSEPFDSLDYALNQLGQFNNFSSYNATYESLKASGKFEEMWDLETRIAILDNYITTYKNMKDIETYLQKNFDTNVLPYFIDEMIFKNVDRRQEQVLEPHFKNILALHLSFLQQKITATNDLRLSTQHLEERFKKLTEK